MSNIERYRKMANEPSDIDVAAIAAEAYGDDYYSDPGKYEDMVLQQRLLGLSPDDPRRLENISKSAVGLSPDMSYAAILSGLDGDGEMVQAFQQMERDLAVARIAEQQAAEQARLAEAQQNRLAQQQQATENKWDDWGIFSVVKGTVRTGFSAIEAPFQVASNTWRAYGGGINDANRSGGTVETIANIFGGTDLGQMGQAIADGRPVDTGDGWFGVDENSQIGRDRMQAEGLLWTLDNGDIATVGRAYGDLFDLDKDSTAYGLVSGLIDASTRVFDPGMYIGVGEATAAARVGRAYLSGGADAAAAARAVGNKSVIGAGVSAAREALQNRIAAAAPLREAVDNLSVAEGLVREARANAGSARQTATEAAQRRNAMVQAQMELEAKSVDARQRSIDIESKFYADRAAREAELAAERDAALAEIERIDNLQARLTGDVEARGAASVPSDAPDLLRFVDEDPELNRLQGEWEAAMAAGDNAGVTRISAQMDERQQAVTLEWADAALNDPAIRKAFLRDQGVVTEPTPADLRALRADFDAQTAAADSGEFAARSQGGAVEIFEEPGGLTSIQKNIWKGQGRINFTWAQREFNSAEEFWSWFHTGNRNAHLSFEPGARDSFANEFGYSPSWGEIRETLFSSIGKGRTLWAKPPWVRSNADFDAWVDDIIASGEAAAFDTVANNPRILTDWLRAQQDTAARALTPDDLARTTDELNLATGGKPKQARLAAARRAAKVERQLLELGAKSDGRLQRALSATVREEKEIADDLARAQKRFEEGANAEELARARWEMAEQQAQRLEAEAAQASAHATQVSEEIRKTYDLGDDLSDPRAIMDYLENELGVLHLPGGKKVLDVELALNAITGGKLDAIARAISTIDDAAIIGDLTRGKIADPALLRALAKADTPERVKSVMAGALARGELSHSTGRLRMLRQFSRYVGDRPYIDQLGQYNRAFGTPAKAIRWSMSAKERRVPWSYNMHIEDGPAMVRGTMDFISYVTKGWKADEAEQFYRQWVNRMIDAPSGVDRKAVGFEMLNDLAQKALRDADLTDDELDLFRKAFIQTKDQRLGEVAYNANSRAWAQDNVFRLGGKEYGDGNMPMLESMMNEHFWFPDPKKLRRLVKSADAIKKRGGDANAVRRAYNTLFDDYWRTAVLLKPSYIVRNIGEMQGRMFVNRHPSVFTNPFAIAAVAMEGEGRLSRRMSKFLKAWDTANLDATGRQFERHPEADEAFDAMTRDWFDLLDNQTSVVDIGSPAGTARYERMGYKTIDQDSPEFWRGAANEVLLLNSSPLARAVLGVASGKPSKDVVEWAQARGMNFQEAVVDMALNGPLKSNLDTIRSAARDIDLQDALRQVENVDEFLFSQTNSFSLWSRWNDFTHGFNSTFIDELQTATFQKHALGSPALADDTLAREQLKVLAGVMRKTLGDAKANGEYRVLKVTTPMFVPAKASEVGQIFRSGTNAFFRTSGKFEKATSIAPELRYAYWDSVATLVSGMSPNAAAALVKTAEQSLGGVTSAWASKTLRSIKANAKKASGELSQDDIHRMAMNQAGKEAEDLFYIAMKRNQVAHALRFIFPFAQAWANSLKVYSRLVTQNSQTVYRASVFAQAAQGRDSNVVYEAMAAIPGDPLGVSEYDPNQGFIYRDPISQQASLMIPGASTAVGLISGLASANGGVPMNVGTSIDSMNMIFQNGWGPGFGPMVTWGAQTVTGTDFYNTLPGWMKVADIPGLKEQLETFQDPNKPDQGAILNLVEGLTPGPVKGLLAMAGVEFMGVGKKYEHQAAAWLFSSQPQAYLNAQGFIDEQGSRQLQKDAQLLGRSLALGQSLVKFVAPGSIVPQLYAQGEDGTLVAQYIINQEFRDLTTAYAGDQGLAWQAMEKKYGINALMTLAPSRGSGTFPTNEAYDFMRQNPEIDVDPETLEFFFSGGAYSLAFDRYQKRLGLGQRLTVEEQIQWSDRLLYTAQKDQLSRQNEAGLLSDDDYKAATSSLQSQFAGVLEGSFDPNKYDRQRARIITALENPAIAGLPSARAISIYLQLREAAMVKAQERGFTTLNGAQVGDLRDWLYTSGEDLRRKYPEFNDAWLYLFSGEVNPK